MLYIFGGPYSGLTATAGFVDVMDWLEGVTMWDVIVVGVDKGIDCGGLESCNIAVGRSVEGASSSSSINTTSIRASSGRWAYRCWNSAQSKKSFSEVKSIVAVVSGLGLSA